MTDFFHSIGTLWHPIWLIWWTIVGVPIHAVLKALLAFLNGNPIADAIGPFGVAIVLLTILIKLIISPVFQYQLTTSRRVQAEQRRIAPHLAALRKKYKKDPQRLNQETMALYKEHNINPLAQMSGCLPALVQSPILIALFYVIRDAHQSLPIHNFRRPAAGPGRAHDLRPDQDDDPAGGCLGTGSYPGRHDAEHDVDPARLHRVHLTAIRRRAGALLGRQQPLQHRPAILHYRLGITLPAASG